MSTITENRPAPSSSSAEQAKLARRHSRRLSLFEPQLMRSALWQAFVMLRPDIQWKNPVMFVVEVGTLLSILFTVAKVFGYPSQVSLAYLLALDIWLFLTVLFANFASALAEARGKAQADALRKTRQETRAFRIRNYDAKESFLLRTPGTALAVEGTNGPGEVEGIE